MRFPKAAIRFSMVVLSVSTSTAIGRGQASLQRNDLDSEEFPPQGTTAQIGDGYNTLTGTISNNQCIVYHGTDQELSPYKPAQSTVTVFESISSRQSLRSALSLSVAASFGFGIFSSSGSFDEYDRSSFSGTHQSLMLNEIVTNATRTLRSATLTDDAKHALSKGARNFVDVCGDSYIAGFVYGGDFSVSYDVTQNHQSTYRDLAADLRVSVATFGSGTASLHQTLQSLQAFAAVNSSLVRNGSEDPIPSQDPDALEKYWRDFPVKVTDKQHPFAIKVILAPYVGLKDVPESADAEFDSVAQAVRFLRLVREGLEENRAAADTLRDAQVNPIEYVQADVAYVTAQIDSNQTIGQSLRQLAIDCRNDTRSCSQKLPQIASTNLLRKRWKLLDPTVQYYGNDVAVFSTSPQDSREKLELRGSYCVKGQYFCLDTSTGNDRIAFIDRSTGTTTERVYGSVPLTVPPNTEVRVYLLDGQIAGSYQLGAADNQAWKPNPIRATLYPQ